MKSSGLGGAASGLGGAAAGLGGAAALGFAIRGGSFFLGAGFCTVVMCKTYLYNIIPATVKCVDLKKHQ